MGAMPSFKYMLVLLFLVTQAWRAHAQVTCKKGWDWMNNTANLNPCQIIESLDSWCLNIQWTVPPLPDGYIFLPPDNSSTGSAVCDCNSPMYMLYSACAACQGSGWVKWSEWSSVCSVAPVGKRPDDFLVTTPIPHWAFINVTVNNTFVPDAAKLAGDLPEQPVDGPTTTFRPTGSSTQPPVKSTSLPPVKSTSLTISPSSSSVLPLTVTTQTPDSKPSVGAIAGGTIGGLAALCLIGLGLVFFRKGRRLKIPKIRRASGPMSLFDPQDSRLDPDVEAVAVKRPLLYDPSNPATFSQVHAELERPLRTSGGAPGVLQP